MADTPEATVQLLYDMFAQGKVQELWTSAVRVSWLTSAVVCIQQFGP